MLSPGRRHKGHRESRSTATTGRLLNRSVFLFPFSFLLRKENTEALCVGQKYVTSLEAPEFGGPVPRGDGRGQRHKVVRRDGVLVGEGRVTLRAIRLGCPQTPSRFVGRGGSTSPINFPLWSFSQDTPFSRLTPPFVSDFYTFTPVFKTPLGGTHSAHPALPPSVWV